MGYAKRLIYKKLLNQKSMYIMQQNIFYKKKIHV